MADMDELFGSDGDSDNDQRGNDVSQPVCGVRSWGGGRGFPQANTQSCFVY